MSQTNADAQTKQKRRKLNPATCTREELIAHLSADPGAGLSPREAAKRRDRSLTAALYGKSACDMRACVLSMLRDIAPVLLLCVAIFALFFDRVALGVACLVLTLGHMVVCVLMYRHGVRVDAAMQAGDAPLARVLRGRRIRRIGPEALVPGDILILHPGDMVPADARLLRSDELVVSERPFYRDPDRETVPVRLPKDADAVPETGTVRRHSPENMVFAGGVVEAGFAVAIVVAVGQDTHLGGLNGSVAPAHPTRMPAVLIKLSRPLTVLNLCLTVLVIPLTVIGIMTLGDRHELIDIVLSVLSLATLTLTGQIMIKGRMLAAVHRRDAAVARDAINTVDIKSAADLEMLTAIDELLLVGTAALHDGKPHPVGLCIGTTEYRCDHPDADDAAVALAELMWLYANPPMDPTVNDRTAPSEKLAAVLPSVVAELADWTEMDREALALKASDIRCRDGIVSAVMPTVEGNRRVGVQVTERIEDLYACDECFTAGMLRTAGREKTPDMRPTAADERLEELERTYRAALHDGLAAFFIIRVVSGRRIVHAMVTYAPGVCPKTVGSIRALEAAGVRVSAYLRDVSTANTRMLSLCGLAGDDGAVRPLTGDGRQDRRPAIQDLRAGKRAFEGCDTRFIRDAIRDLHAEGRTVAVLSTEATDGVLFEEADLAVTCAPSFYMNAESGDTRIAVEDAMTAKNPYAGPDGLADGTLATDLCRRRADILVRRSATTGGGVCAFRNALLTADRFRLACDRLYTYLLMAELLRLAACVVPLCLGLAPASAIGLLISGLVGDTVVAIGLSRLPALTAPQGRRKVASDVEHPWRTHRGLLILTAIFAVLPWVTAGVAKLLRVDFGDTLIYYGILCLFGLQLAAFRTERLPRRDSTVFITTLIMVFLYVGALAVALGAGLPILWSLVLPAVWSVLFGVARYVFDKMTVNTR